MWHYENKIIESPPEGYIGFIYLITNLMDGRKYIGRKNLYNKKINIKTITQKNGIKKKKKIRSLVESDWKDYWSSSDMLKDDIIKLGEDAFKREIIYFCKSDSEMTYLESREIFDKRALETTDYYNQWVMCKIRKSNILNKI